jgi:protoporphyrinogen IX oxidase
MIGFLGGYYLWVKAAHIIFVIFWMAGLFLFPRYLVHHQESLDRPDEAARWIERERKLMRIILAPSLTFVFVFGLLLAANIGVFDATPGLGWFHVKFVLVMLLVLYQGWARMYSWRLARGEARLSSRRLRMLNEIPGLAVILIVILAVVKPF